MLGEVPLVLAARVPLVQERVDRHPMHVETEFLRRVADRESDQFREVEDRHVDVLVRALERRLVEVELLEAARAHDHERVDLLVLQVVELPTSERERAFALTHAVKRAAAALHLGRVVHDLRAECRHEFLDLGRIERIVPAHRGLRAQEVAAVVHGHAHAPQRLGDLRAERSGADGIGKPLGEVDDVEVAGVVQVLAREPLVNALTAAPIASQVARGLLERRVAAVARCHEAETGLLDDREVARCGRVEGVLVVGLHERALRATRVARKLVHARTQVVEDQPRRLLDEGEPRRDRASPEDRELPHAPTFSSRAGLIRAPNKPKRPPGPMRSV